VQIRFRPSEFRGSALRALETPLALPGVKEDLRLRWGNAYRLVMTIVIALIVLVTIAGVIAEWPFQRSSVPLYGTPGELVTVPVSSPVTALLGKLSMRTGRRLAR
jgi:hypothetical protein